ncbi:MAG TPA: hypothetical protein DCY79_23195 [Planctomycetaceae bacterium]|nr:hypothetical protein [Blastopirellula sp.]HAY82726.1 hypothetical protein [Planctomycetaceae bacterium]
MCSRNGFLGGEPRYAVERKTGRRDEALEWPQDAVRLMTDQANIALRAMEKQDDTSCIALVRNA